jgi:hypothetical protein
MRASRCGVQGKKVEWVQSKVEGGVFWQVDCFV